MLAAALAAEADAYLAELAGERDERSQRLVVRCKPHRLATRRPRPQDPRG
jgi:putative transposase